MKTDDTDTHRYHHGDLRKALLAAAEAELQDRGIEGFSLRSVAKRAGVSHAAPAHHFKDANGLLTALAAEGFGQFIAAMERREADGHYPPLESAGLGYVDFARDRPALFKLIFASQRPDFADPELCAIADAAFAHLVDRVSLLGGTDADVASVWAMAHGLADLMSAGRLKMVASLPQDAREQMLTQVMQRAFPAK